MKYTELLQLQTFFSRFKKIDFIKRINDNILELSFDRERFIFDLTRAMSAIYTAKFNAKIIMHLLILCLKSILAMLL